ncbi:MAG: LamG domain-containing protein [Bacteroidetes bacterium]|nr:LamG domain-containing protein [Bacteroidota bacterium]
MKTTIKIKVMSKTIAGIFFIVFCVMPFVFCSAQSLTTGLVGYWKLDETSGNNPVDAIGNNNLINTNSTPFVAAKINNGASFTASSSQKFQKSSSIGLPVTGDFSLQCWYKGASPVGDGLFGYGLSQSYGTWRTILVVSGCAYFGGYSVDLNSNYTITDGNWHHIVVTGASGAGTIYVDGISRNTGSFSGLTSAGTTLSIGVRPDNNYYITALIDECAIWSRALTAAEVTSLYNSGNGLAYPFVSTATVTTQAVSSIAAITATGNGNVTANGGATITERGVCWNTSTSPTSSNSKATAAGTTGAFTASITGLTMGTLYYVKAYAVNSVGISYGNEVSFTTFNVPTITTQAVTSIASTTATANGNITADGGATITERGVCWNTSTTPTTANSKATAAGTTGAFTASMTSLTPGTLYYARAYAINSAGISYGNEVSFTTLNIPTITTQAVTIITATTATGNGNVSADGGATITERGVCWNTSSTPTTANSKSTSSGTTGAFTTSLTGLTAGTPYYVRAYAINSVGISYGNELAFTTLNIASVTTQAVTNITTTTATGNGNVTADGGATITERGVCWNTSATPTTANSKTTSAGTTGAFTASMTGLTAGALYYVRAYAINSVGISYGNQVTFYTPAPASVNWNNSNVQEITLTSNRTFTFANGKSGGIYHLIIKQNGTGGWTVTWPANVGWTDGTPPDLTITSNAVDVIKFIYDGTNYLGIGITLNIHH